MAKKRTVKTCNSCGRFNTEAAKYCSSCGAAFAAGSTPSPAVEPVNPQNAPSARLDQSEQQLNTLGAWSDYINKQLETLFTLLQDELGPLKQQVESLERSRFIQARQYDTGLPERVDALERQLHRLSELRAQTAEQAAEALQQIGTLNARTKSLLDETGRVHPLVRALAQALTGQRQPSPQEVEELIGKKLTNHFLGTLNRALAALDDQLDEQLNQHVYPRFNEIERTLDELVEEVRLLQAVTSAEPAEADRPKDQVVVIEDGTAQPYCSNCGVTVRPNANFCGTCGAALAPETAEPDQPVAAQAKASPARRFFNELFK